MRLHRNAKTTPKGRALLVARVTELGWPVVRAAHASGVSTRTAYKWLARYRREGHDGLHDRASAPHRRPRRTRARVEQWILGLRAGRRLSGPAIAWRTGIPRATVGNVLRRHGLGRLPPQMTVARLMRELLEGSSILPSHKTDDPRVQDPYSLRCTPQVLGAAMDTLAHVRAMVERELGAVTDNPLVFPDNGEIISAGNFHGMPMAIILDLLTIALAHIAGISERRVYFLLSASDSENPLNAYLSPQPGLHSGLMIAQYTAAAACNEIQTLATPASVHNVRTSAGMEDYNSFGPLCQ